MKVRTKKGIVEVAKSFNDYTKALKRVGSASSAFDGLARTNYLIWKSSFEPQSQRVINIVLMTGLLLAMAEIVWYVMEKL